MQVKAGLRGLKRWMLAPLRRCYRNRVHAVLRGQSRMRTEGRLPLIVQIKHDISHQSLPAFSTRASGYIFHDTLGISELIIRQYLMIRVAGVGLHRSILAAFGGARGIHVLPPHILRLLAEKGVPTRQSLSRLVWLGYVVAVWGYGILTIARLARHTRPSSARLSAPKSTAVFVGAVQGNLPSERPLSDRYDLLSWHHRWSGRSPAIRTLAASGRLSAPRHSGAPEVVVLSSELVALPDWSKWAQFVLWALAAILRSFWDLLRGRWWHALLLADAAKARVTHLTPAEDLAAEYWFSHTGYIYRPIWTYGAARKGADLYLYFYSVNNSAILKAGEPDLSIGAWPLMNWTNYVVWNEVQAAFIREVLPQSAETPHFHVVGDLPFVDGSADLPAIQGKKLALFDIQPYRLYKHASQAQVFEYYNSICATAVLRDVAEICAEHDLKMMWKRKREVSKSTHPHYQKVENDLVERTETVVSIDPSISAHRVIAESAIVVSVPFTSTALIARNLCKPSCYYDPSGLLASDDKAAHGIPILLGRAQLENWIAEQLSQ
ncbi:polysaccharide biosynthesis PFTS motif protein [Anianabacter salinae]|uniref:polysaccharide biosynthesis PFTS motif protein n=1 Tax=Anianabacter salinae TaxID=2851023 RepID=UPI00225E03EE|nr:polysaccharide biosynthesis PFTS motif protein [Anianabacter salinae]MBV0914171.1 polysaccharide biosynthesis PFTS motif protein [Anianabacter salinae]